MRNSKKIIISGVIIMALIWLMYLFCLVFKLGKGYNISPSLIIFVISQIISSLAVLVGVCREEDNK